MLKPITREEVQAAFAKREFPDFVIQAFNECIFEAKLKGTTTVKQDAVMAKIVAASGETRGKVYENHWLDVEDHYRAAGWTVTYEKPAYNEFFEAYFTFK
jgi:hypothetical protein